MGTQIVLSLMALFQATTTPVTAATSPQNAVQPSPPPPPAKSQSLPPASRCDARQWQQLVGRTVSDLLTAKLPAGTRVYRLDDPPSTTNVSGRLSVELNRSTRVRRVYCS
jgi:hypothetical protein